MKLYAGLLILLISLGSAAQSGKVAFTVSPLEAIEEISFPTIQAGIEYKVGRHFSWYNELGVGYRRHDVGWPDTLMLRPQGIKVKSELRYYVKVSQYVAFNVFLWNDVHNTQVEYSYTGDTAILRTDDFGVRKRDFGWNVVYGWEERLIGRFWADMYVGLGMRFGDIHTFGEQFNYSRDYIIHPIDPNIPYLLQKRDAKAGHGVVPNLTAGVRVLYRF